MKKRDILIWLNNIQGMNNRYIDVLKKYLGDIRELQDISNSAIDNIPIGAKAKKGIKAGEGKKIVENILIKAEEQNTNIITIVDDDFPERLKVIPDPPRVIYIKGEITEDDLYSISIIGTRKPTSYGIYAVEKLTDELSDLGITIVSGMASGIDTFAHLTSLKNNNRTIAVLGTGVDVVYPSHNKNIYNNIINEGKGAVISEFPLGTKGLPYHFPQRNRIISGLSLGTLVIEAEKRSGTMITVSHCLEQGKEVFAVPGGINNNCSRGTNHLIRDGAKLVENSSDIIEELIELKTYIERKKLGEYAKDGNGKSSENNSNKYSSLEKRVIEIAGRSPISANEMSRELNIDIVKLNGILTVLEIKGEIKRMNGNKLTV